METCPNCSSRVASLPHGLVNCVDALDTRLSITAGELEDLSDKVERLYMTEAEVDEKIREAFDANSTSVDEDTKDELRTELHEFMDSHLFAQEALDNRHMRKALGEFVDDHLATKQGYGEVNLLEKIEALEQNNADLVRASHENETRFAALAERIAELEAIVNGK